MILVKQNHQEEKEEGTIAGFEIRISGNSKTIRNEIAALLNTLLENDDFRPLAREAVLANLLGGVNDLETQEEENEPCITDRQIN